jgi:F-type H+-transporting ATPase subunit b
MNSFVLFASIGSELANSAHETARQFGWTKEAFIAQCISFCIVAFLLHKLAYKRILTVLEERRQRIAESIANAEKMKAELAKAEAQRQEILTQANAQAQKFIEEARAAAARVQEQETQKAIAAAEQIIAKAREAAAQDHARMLTELKREVGRLVVQTTATVTGKILTPDDQRRLSEETAKAVAK